MGPPRAAPRRNDGAPAAPGSPDLSFWGDGRPRVRRPRRPRPDGPLERAREVVGAWRGDPRVGFAMLVCIAVVAGVVWYRVGVGGADGAPPRRAVPAATGAQLPARADATPSTTTAARDLVVVHVAGAVTRPGVVELDPGARVIDAVEAAGGAVPEADLDRLNLAAKVADGERILVSRIGDAPAADGADPAEAGSSSADAPTSPGSGPINLNTATVEQLDALPGIGPVLAQAILDERNRRGRFRSVQELREVRGIGEKRFADLANRVTV